jgi:apolipoprotein N-acyltransferase
MNLLLLLPIVSGALLALALPPLNLGWLGWVAVAPLLVATRGRRPIEAFGLGLMAGLTCGGIHVGWHSDAHGLHFAYLPFLWLAMLLGTVAAVNLSPRPSHSLEPVAGVGALPAAREGEPQQDTVWNEVAAENSPSPRRGGGQGERSTQASRPREGMIHVTRLASLALLAEWLTTVTPLPVHLALTQYHTLEVLQIAALTGIWGVSFLLWWSNAAIADAVARRQLRTTPVLATLAMLLLTLGYGRLILHRAESGPSVRVAAIQDHSSGETEAYVRPVALEGEEPDREALTRQAVARGARLVVWSEGCLGNAFSPESPSDETIALARKLRAHLVVGYAEAGAPKGRNCAAIVTPDGQVAGVHQKIHLFMGERNAVQGGRDARAFDTSLGRLGVEICFDSCYTGVTRCLVADGAQLIAMPNYDPPTPRGVLHHLHAAVLPFRAVENGVPFVRADASGASQIIDAHGRILAQSPLFASDALVADVPLGSGRGTPFTRWGDWLVYSAILGTALGMASASSRASRQRETS